MKIRHRIAYDKEMLSEAFFNFLKEKNAEFEINNSSFGVAFIYEEDEWKDDLYSFLRTEKLTSIIDTIYTKDEFENAEWFSIRSKFRFGYPQPEDSFGYKSYTYESAEYCSNCGCGLKQKDNFRINKAPNWGKRHFLMLNWIQDELFTSEIARQSIMSKKIIGLKFLDVKNHKKSISFDDIHQIYVEEVLQPGLADVNQSAKQVLECSNCGEIKYIYSGKGLTYHKGIFEGINSDIVKTSETFGDGHMCARKILISKKFYQAIKDDKLDKDLVFEPISLI